MFEMPPDMKAKHEERFKMLHRKLKKHGELSSDFRSEYENIIYLSSLENLYEWTSKVFAVLEKEAGKPKPEPKKGWFNSWWGSTNSQQEEELYEKIFEDIDVSQQDFQVQIPRHYVWLELQFNLDKGIFKLNKKISESQDQSLSFTYEGLCAQIGMRQPGGDFSVSMQNFSVQTDSETVCQKLNCSSYPVWQVDLNTKPLQMECEASLHLQSQPLEINYSSEAVSQIISFFVVPNADQNAKMAAWDTIQELQDTTQGTITDLLYGETKYLIHIAVSGPRVRIPCANNKGNFLVNLGKLKLNNSLEINEGMYENFKVSVSDIELLYEEEVQVPVISKFGIKTKMDFMKSRFRKSKWDLSDPSLFSEPDFVFRGKLPSFTAFLSPSIYNKLLKLPEVFSIREDVWSSISLEKSEILKSAALISKLNKKGTGVQSWYKYLAVLSGPYIYFFNNEKETFASSYFYVKDCDIVDVSGEIGVDYSIMLENRFGQCVLSFDKEPLFRRWFQGLSDKVTDLESYTSAAASSYSKSKVSKSLVNFTFAIPAFSVVLTNEERVKLTQFELGKIKTQVAVESMKLSASASLASLLVHDLQRPSTPHFSTLIRTYHHEKLIHLDLCMLNSNHPNYQHTDMDVQIAFGSVELNWNPDLLTSIMNFFEFAGYSEQAVQKTEAVGELQPSHVLLNLKVFISNIDLYLNTVENEISLAVASISNLNSRVLLMNGGWNWEGELGNLEVCDLTNYPSTVIQEKVKPFKLFSLREGSKSLLRFSIFFFSEDNPAKPKDIGGSVDLELSSVQLVFLNQPFMRIVDFFNYKILGLFDTQSRVRDANHWSPIYKLSHLLNLSAVQSLQEGISEQALSFTKFSIQIHNPLVTLTPRPDYEDYFLADLGNITISNYQKLSDKRGDTVWDDVYKIQMANINISVHDQKVAEEFNLDMEIERPVMTPKQERNPSIDKRFFILGKCAKIYLTLDQANYCLLLKLFDLNLSYDDQLDNFINPNCAPPIQPSDDPDHGGVFIDLNLDIDIISVLLNHEAENILEIFTCKQTLVLKKYNDYSMDIRFESFNLLGLISSEMVESELASEELVGHVFTVPSETLLGLLDYDSSMRLSHILLGPLYDSENKTNKAFTLDLKSAWDGNKDIVIEMSQFRINFHYAAILQVQNFFYYGIPDYSKDYHTPFDYMDKFRPSLGLVSKELQTTYEAPRLGVNLFIKQPILVLPSFVSSKVLVAQSDVTFVYMREHEGLSKGGEVPSCVKRFTSHELEIYSCNLEQLSNESSFQTIRKRKIVEPLQAIWESTEERVQQTYMYKVNYMLGALQATISHRDLLLLGNIMKYQQETLQKGNDLIEALQFIENFTEIEEIPEINETILRSEEKPVFRRSVTQRRKSTLDGSQIKKQKSLSEESQEKFTTITNFSLAGLYAILVNDASGAYSPLISVNLGDLNARMTQKESNWTLATMISLKSNFYNPIFDVWEPLVELFNTRIDVVDSPENTPKQQVIVLVEEEMPFNISISEIMVNHMFLVSESWTQTSQPSEETKEVVSLLAIQNKTGYPIMAEKKSHTSNQQTGSLIVIDPDQTLDYEVDSTEIRNLDFSTEYFDLTLYKEGVPLQPIKDVPINKVQALTYLVELEGETVPINVEIKLNGTRKVLTVTSNVLIVNETEFNFRVLFSKPHKTNEVECLAGAETPVPVDFEKHLLGLAPNHLSLHEWSMISLQEFCMRKHGHYTEIRIENFYLVVYLQKLESNPKVSYLHIKAPVIFRNSLPCEIEVSIIIDRKKHLDTLICVQGTKLSSHKTSGHSETSIVVTLPNMKKSSMVPIISRREKTPRFINLQDFKKQGLQLLLDYKNQGAHIFTFFVDLVVINNTQLPVSFSYRKRGASKTIPAQNFETKMLPCNSTKKMAVHLGSKKSQYFKTGAVGAQSLVSIESEKTPSGHKMLYEFVYEVYLAQAIKDELLFTKTVVVSPRFLLVNKMDQSLFLKQYGSSSAEVVLTKETTMPFHWPDNSQPNQLLQVKVAEGSWDWSGALSISSIANFAIQCKNLEDFGIYKLVNVQVKLMNCTAYVVFEEEDENQCSYRIENHSKYTSMLVYQHKSKSQSRWVNVNTYSAFAWAQPLNEHRISIEFFDGALEDYPVQTGAKYSFSFDKINQTYMIKIMKTSEIGHMLYGMTCNDGSTKVLKFADVPLGRYDPENERIYTQYNLNISKFGISLVEHYQNQSTEIMYFSAKDVVVLAQRTKHQWKSEMIVQSMQIDNQYNPNALFPVLLYPGTSEVHNVLQLSLISYIGSQNTRHFETCELLIQDLTLNLESLIVKKLLQISGRLFLGENPVYEVTQLYEMNSSESWMHQEFQVQDTRYYFEKLKLCPIKILISFVPLKDLEESSVDSFATVANALGMVITAIDSAPIRLYSVEMNDVFGSRFQIIMALWMHYKAQLASELFTLIGHAEILGNPIGLLNNLGTGVFDFFYEPAQGMIQGPVSAGKGLIKGAGSLFKNTVEGTFGTVSKLANSFATGITNLTQDHDYILDRQREKAKNRPDNVVSGLGMGFKSFFSGVGKGLTGIVTDPVKGYKKNKIKGMFMGGFRGISGLVVKPMAGMLDAASRTAEGIKNTTKVFEKATTFQRQRAPRPLYGPNCILKPYNEYDAQVLFFMGQLKKGMFWKERFMGQVVAKDLRGQVMVCVVYLHKTVLANPRDKKVTWIVENESILTTEILEKGVALHTLPSNYKKTKNKTSFLVPLAQQSHKSFIHDKILEALKFIFK